MADMADVLHDRSPTSACWVAAQHVNTRPVEGLACQAAGQAPRREQPMESARSMRGTGDPFLLLRAPRPRRHLLSSALPGRTSCSPFSNGGPGDDKHGACLDSLESPASCHLAGRCPSARRPIEPDVRARGASATHRNFSDVDPVDRRPPSLRPTGWDCEHGAELAASCSCLFVFLLAWIESGADGARPSISVTVAGCVRRQKK